MKNRLFKRPLALLMALSVIVSTLLALPIIAQADTPQSLESSVLSFWADPEETITQDDIDGFTSGTKTTMVGAVGVHKRQSSASQYYLFLPSNADCTNLKVWFTASSASVTADGVTTDLVSGEATDAFAAINDGGISKSYTLTIGSSSYNLTAIKSGEVGAVYIDTASGSISKINSSSDHSAGEAGTILIVDAEGNVQYDGDMEKMTGRGNGTWSTSNAKNPYNVKLAVSTSLLGMGKAKKWCLLANNNDSSLVKNQLTYDFADYIGVKYQPHCKPVDVYVNQQYFGSYQLAEKVEIKSSRIDVTDAYENLEIANSTIDETTGLLVPPNLGDSSAKIVTANGTTSTSTTGSYAVGVRKYSTNLPGEGSSSGSTGGWGSIIGGGIGGSTSTGPAIQEPSDYTGGYLYELEISQRWVNEKAGFCAYNRQGWVIKSCNVASKNMVDYSYDLLYALGSSVYNGGTVPSGATTTTCSSGKTAVRTTNNPAPATQYQGKKWSDILDADSALKYYWTQEYFKNMDSSTSSTYFYKDSDTVDTMLYAGPVWDMDNSIGYEQNGSRWGHSWTSYDDWYTKNTRIYRFYASDSTTSYSTDAYAPLSFYGALATKCTDFWAMAQSYWYATIFPATQVLLGNEVDPTGTLHSTEYYINTVAKSNTMDNMRLLLNNNNAWNYDSMVTGMNQWFTNRNAWINGQIPQVNISNATFSTIPSQTCTGNEIEPEFSLTYNGATLIEGIDYTTEYSNNINASRNATITVTGKGYYTGTKSTTFTIGAGSLVNGAVSIPDEAYAGDVLEAYVTDGDDNQITKFVNYQWKANGIAIAGATDSYYVVADADKGKSITVTVSGDGTNIATVGTTSNICAVSTEDKKKGYTKTIAAWDYDYSTAPDALVTADEAGLEYYYTATSGDYADTAQLTASVDATTTSKIKWSGADLYTNTATTISPDQTPVIGTSKTDGIAWGQYPYFQTEVSTLNFEDITFSAKLGGSKKAPSTWMLQYSLDGKTFTDVEDSAYTIYSNKSMVDLFEDVTLPALCNNREKVYIRVIVCDNIAINGVDTIVGSLSGDAAINNIAIKGASTLAVTQLEAPSISTSSVTESATIFDDENVVITDNNGGADVYYTINGGEAVLYEGELNPFGDSAKLGDTAVVTAYAKFEEIQSESTTFTVTYGGENINSFRYDDYSLTVSNGTVYSNGGAYGESGKMTAVTDGNSQFVPLWNSSNGSYGVSPDDGALWSSQSGFYYQVSTAGYENIAFSCQAYTTAQGPNSVSLQYSTDGTSWTTVQSNVTLAANAELENLFVTAALPAVCNNQASLYIRLATTENLTNGGTTLWNNASKGNLYVNNVVVSGDSNGDYKMPYTNKATCYFGSGEIKYHSPDGLPMQYRVTDPDSNIVLSGVYPEAGIVISTIDGFNPYVAGPYTVSVWVGDDDDKSAVNTRKYYYKGETITKFNYNDTKKLLANYLNDDATEASNTSGTNAGTLSVYPNATDAAMLTYTSTYGVKATWSATNPFAATKNLDNPNGNGYWLVKTSTLGYNNVTLNLEQLSSNKGPRDWGIAYSTDGVHYTYVENSNVRTVSNDATTAPVETYNNFALPAECDNQENLYIKVFINGGESVDGTELELITKGNTGINGIELSGIAIPKEISVDINTIAYESINEETPLAVDAKVMVNGQEYQATNGTATVTLTQGVQYTVYASVNGTFVNKAVITATEGEAVTIAVVSIDMNADGYINGKDFASILRVSDANKKALYRAAFTELSDTSEDEFTYQQ